MRALLFALALFVPAVAFAEPVTYHMTGTVESVEGGGPLTLDLTGTFTPGMTFTLDLTVERSAVPAHPDQWTYIYSGMGQNAHFTIGNYACTGAAASDVIVENDFYGFDDLEFIMYTLTAPPIGAATPGLFQLQLQTSVLTVLDSGVLPRPMPDMSNWTTKTFALTFSDAGGATGVVSGSFTDVSTPAFAMSWGGLKDHYRH